MLRMGKMTLLKVSEYMKHHEEAPCSEIRTPLMGDSLQDCGATRRTGDGFRGGVGGVDRPEL